METPESRQEQARPAQARINGRFARGVSGNPGGRPKNVGEIRELARQHGPAAIAKLVALTHSKDQMVALHACRALLDRGYGRPEQSVQLDARINGAPDPARPMARTAAEVLEAWRTAPASLPTPAPPSLPRHQAAGGSDAALRLQPGREAASAPVAPAEAPAQPQRAPRRPHEEPVLDAEPDGKGSWRVLQKAAEPHGVRILGEEPWRRMPADMQPIGPIPTGAELRAAMLALPTPQQTESEKP